MRILPNILLLAIMALAGCESMSDRVEERFRTVPPKVQVFAGNERTVRAAVQLAFKRLDFDVSSSTGGGEAIEASGRIRHSQALGDSRQLVATVHLQELGPAQTEVRILLSEEVEENAAGGSSEQALREHGFYGTFFDTVQQILAGQAEPSTPDSPH
jgi:hypothetical protein